MNHEPTPEELLQSLLHDEADSATASRLAEHAGGDPAMARRVGEELEFSEMLRQVLRGGELSGEKFDSILASDGLSSDDLVSRVVDGSATTFECDQVVKHLCDYPEATADLQRSLVIDEWIAEAVSESKSGEAFVEALETRMWAETNQDHFVEDFTALLDNEIDPPENIVAFPGSWIAPLAQVGAVAAALAVGAFFAVQHFTGTERVPMVASVVKSSSDASWSQGSTQVQNGGLKSGRYQLDSGVVSLRFSSGSEMTVQGPAMFDVYADSTAFVHHGVALARQRTTDMGISLQSKGLTVSDSAHLVGIDARSERSTNAILFEGDGGICLTDRGICRELYEMETIKADFDRDKLVNIPYNPYAFAKAWELLSGVEKNIGSVRIEMPGSKVGPSSESAGEVQVYVENDSFRPEQDMQVDRIQVGEFASAEINPGQSLQSRGDLRSYLLQLWPSDGSGAEEVEASLTFDHPVVGVIYSSDRLASSDGSVGSSITHVGEEFNDLRGLDSGNDLILLSKDRKTLNLKLKGGASQIDQVRVLVALN